MSRLVAQPPLSECPDLAIFLLGGRSLIYRGNIVTTTDGLRWLHMGPVDKVCTRVALAHAVFVAENLSELFLKGLVPDLQVEGGEASGLSGEPMRRANAD